MPEKDLEVAILMADISGSSALYEMVGNAEALRLVGICLDNLRAIVERKGGTFIRSKGDDVLAIFADTAAALTAARTMLSQQLTGPSLAIHVGASFGPVIRARDDVFGDGVNTAARLAAMAKPGELLVDDDFIERLAESERYPLRPLDTITFKGKDAPTKVYALREEPTSLRTVIAGSTTPTDARAVAASQPVVTLTLRYRDQTIVCPARKALSIGRAAGNDIVIEQPWISREHATVRVRRGKVELSDRSSTGTYVSAHAGYEILLKRETVLLADSGIICPGVPPATAEAEVIDYEVTARHPPDAAGSQG